MATTGPEREQLRELLKDQSVRAANAGKVPRLDPADLHRTLAQRGVS